MDERAGAQKSLTSAPRATQPARGVDVSVYQKVVNWPQAKAGGISFAYIRASQGTAYRDPTYGRNTSGANAAGVSSGAYHFYLPTQSPIGQAQNFAAAIKGQPHNLPPAVDVETAAPGVSKSAFASALSTMLSEVQKLTGQKPVIYTSPGFWSSYVANPQLEAQYGLWQAQWNTKAPAQIGAFQTGAWQYQNAAQGVPGFSTPVDLDVMGGRATATSPSALGGQVVTASLPALKTAPTPASGQTVPASGVKENTTAPKAGKSGGQAVAAALPAQTKPAAPASGQVVPASGVKETKAAPKAGQATDIFSGLAAVGVGGETANAGKVADVAAAGASAAGNAFWSGFWTGLGFPASNTPQQDLINVVVFGAGGLLVVIGLLWFMARSTKPVLETADKTVRGGQEAMLGATKKVATAGAL